MAKGVQQAFADIFDRYDYRVGDEDDDGKLSGGTATVMRLMREGRFVQDIWSG
ncbi:MAG: hypothetical protein MHM6MM_008380 [Cercozoa sp. M6MM]